MTIKRLYSGRYEIRIDDKTYVVYNPSKDDRDYPNLWFIQDQDAEGFQTLKDVKQYLSNMQE